jgi:hypothetical protein
VQEEHHFLTSASSPALLQRSFRGISDMNYTETERIVFAVRAFYVGLCVLGESFSSCWRHAAELALGCVMQEERELNKTEGFIKPLQLDFLGVLSFFV